MAMSITRKLNIAGLTILFVGGTVYAFFPYYLATKEMRRFCADLPAGASLSEVQSKAEALGYEVSSLGGGRAVVEDPLSFGRRTCELQFDGQGLVSAKNP